MDIIAWVHANCKFAMPAPSSAQQTQTFYHGTPDEQAGQQILQQGLVIPPEEKAMQNGFMRPVAGKVYLTPSIQYALIYALGGDMAGHQLRPEWITKSRYGYVFQINGADLQDVQPDEDSVGELLYHKNAPYWLQNMAERRVAPNRLKKLLDGEYAYFASVGKQLLRVMSPAQKAELMTLGGHVAHTGPTKPSAAWRVDRSRSQEFARDGSNFFQIAEKVL